MVTLLRDRGAARTGAESLGASGRAGEVEVEMLLVGEADELPHIGEGTPGAVAEVVEPLAAAKAGWRATG